MSPIAPEEETVACRACGTTHHRECWDEPRGCCVKNCGEVSRAIEIDLTQDSTQKLVLTREAVQSSRPHKASRVNNPCLRCGRQVPNDELYCEECAPAREDSQDTRNLGPILIMLALLGVLLAWLVVGMIPNSKPPIEVGPVHAGAKTDR